MINIVDFLHIKPKPVPLHSGGLSQFIIDADGLFEDERMRGAIIAYWKAYLDKTRRSGRFHFIAIPRGGVPWAQALFQLMAEDTDEHRLSLSTDEFTVKPNCSTILIDDVLTTGASLIEVASTLKRDAFPITALTVVDRRWERGSTPGGSLWVTSRQLYLPTKTWTRMPLPMEAA